MSVYNSSFLVYSLYAVVCRLPAKPMTLQCCCRIVIRRQIGRKRLASVNRLPVPSRISAYLNFSEI